MSSGKVDILFLSIKNKLTLKTQNPKNWGDKCVNELKHYKCSQIYT